MGSVSLVFILNNGLDGKKCPWAVANTIKYTVPSIFVGVRRDGYMWIWSEDWSWIARQIKKSLVNFLLRFGVQLTDRVPLVHVKKVICFWVFQDIYSTVFLKDTLLIILASSLIFKWWTAKLFCKSSTMLFSFSTGRDILIFTESTTVPRTVIFSCGISTDFVIFGRNPHKRSECIVCVQDVVFVSYRCLPGIIKVKCHCYS